MVSTGGLGTRGLGVMIFLPTLPRCVPQRFPPGIVGHSSNSDFGILQLSFSLFVNLEFGIVDLRVIYKLTSYSLLALSVDKKSTGVGNYAVARKPC